MKVKLRNKVYLFYYNTYYEAELHSYTEKMENGYLNKLIKYKTREGILNVSEATKKHLNVFDNQFDCLMYIARYITDKDFAFGAMYFGARRLPYPEEKIIKLYKKHFPEENL